MGFSTLHKKGILGTICVFHLIEESSYLFARNIPTIKGLRVMYRML